MRQNELETMIQAARRGEASAREAVFRRLLPLVQAEVRRTMRGASSQEQQDMIGQICLWLAEDMARLLANVEAARSPAALLRIIIRRLAARYLRDRTASKRRLERLAGDLPERTVSDAAWGFPSPDDDDQLRLVLRWAQALSHENRAIFWERLVAERASREVALELGLQAATIDKRAERLRTQLKTWLDQQNQGQKCGW